jgi:dyslexia susceptibility 1 candidate gene 1 protein
MDNTLPGETNSSDKDSSCVERSVTLACLSNRASCYLKLNMHKDCKEDCTLATLAMLQQSAQVEIVPENLSNEEKVLYVKLMMRRGICNCQLGLFDDAINDYNSCLNLLALFDVDVSIKGISKESISSDLDKLKSLANSDNLKKQADALFSQSQLLQAEELYEQALRVVPMHVGCLSNLAACKMTRQDFKSSVEYCTRALKILDMDDDTNKNKPIGSQTDNISMLGAILPQYGTDKRKSWYLKTLSRRAVAYVQLQDIDSAIVDFGKACALDSTDKQLQSDLNKLVNIRAKQNQSQGQ